MKLKRIASFALALVMCFCVFGQCGLAVSMVEPVNKVTDDGICYSILTLYKDEPDGTMSPYPVIYINGLLNTNKTEYLELPSEIDGLRVFGISDRAFENNKTLRKVVVPDSVEVIGNDVFSFTNITELVLSNNLSRIGNSILFANKTLKEIIIPKSITFTSELGAFSGSAIEEAIFQDGETGIPERILSNCQELKKVVIPDSVTIIGKRAFELCVSLESIDMPENLEIIREGAFYQCESLSQINIPDSVYRIEKDAFACCIKFTSLKLPENIEFIGPGILRDVKNVTEIFIPKTLQDLPSSPFFGSYVKKAVFEDGTENIPKNIFKNCNSIEEVIIPDSVKKISDEAFYKCVNLKDVSIPENINYIGKNAFRECSAITEIRLPCDIEFVGKDAFLGIKGDVFYAHNFVITEDIPSSCTHKGYTKYKCTICGKTENRNYKRLIAHSYKNSACILCGKWQYEANEVSLKTVENTASGVKVTWGRLPGADKYIVYRKTAGKGWTRLGTTSGTSFTDKTAKSNVKYIYTVKGQKGNTYSKYSKSGLTLTYIAAPKITVKNITKGAYIEWSKVSGATCYIVYRKTANGQWKRLDVVEKTNFTDVTAKSGVKYVYSVRAVKSAKNGIVSAACQGKTLVRLASPKLTKINAYKGKVSVTFNKVPGATSYIVYRKTANSGWSRVGVSEKVSFNDIGAKKGVIYTYTVKACYGSYTSSYYSKGITVKAK